MKKLELEKLIENKVKQVLNENAAKHFEIKGDKIIITLYNESNTDKEIELINNNRHYKYNAKKIKDGVISVDLWAAVSYYMNNNF
jgi:hypothetical protein